MIIRVKIPYGHISVDLDVLIAQTGTVYDRKYRRIAFKLPQAKKLCQLIIRYGDEETLRKTNDAIRECKNEKLRKIWSAAWEKWRN